MQNIDDIKKELKDSWQKMGLKDYTTLICLIGLPIHLIIDFVMLLMKKTIPFWLIVSTAVFAIAVIIFLYIDTWKWRKALAKYKAFILKSKTLSNLDPTARKLLWLRVFFTPTWFAINLRKQSKRLDRI